MRTEDPLGNCTSFVHDLAGNVIETLEREVSPVLAQPEDFRTLQEYLWPCQVASA